MNKLKILIVEDDPSSMLTLESAVFDLGYTDIYTADNSESALEIIEKQSPDLLLLDIDIKGNLDGIGLAQNVKHLEIPVIFITGFDDPEVHEKAQAVGPHAYLLKPFNVLTLETAIDTALKSTEPDTDDPEEDFILKNCFFIKNGTILQKVKFTEIHWVQSEGNYCMLHTDQKKHAIRTSLSKLVKRLPLDIFVRIHQRYVVQVSLIDRIDTFNGEVYIGNQSLPLGRTYKENLLDQLNKI